MRLELFVILIIATLITLLSGYKAKLSPLISIAGIFLLVCSAVLFSTGLDLEAGTHKYVPSGSIDSNVLDYNITYLNHTTKSDPTIWFLSWSFFIVGLFLLIYGLYLSFPESY